MKKDRREYRYVCHKCWTSVIVKGKHEVVCRNCKVKLVGYLWPGPGMPKLKKER